VKAIKRFTEDGTVLIEVDTEYLSCGLYCYYGLEDVQGSLPLVPVALLRVNEVGQDLPVHDSFDVLPLLQFLLLPQQVIVLFVDVGEHGDGVVEEGEVVACAKALEVLPH
jgi:hypothetical protein